MSEDAGELVRVWRQPDGLWRWEWLSDGSAEDLERLVSHQAFEDVSQAQQSANEAFPGVRILRVSAVESGPGFGWTLLALILVALAAVHRMRGRRDSGS